MINFTEGRVGRSLLLFSLPLLLSNLLQQLYSVVDSVLLGRLVGAHALAAVAAATPVVMLLLSVVTGFSAGAAIVTAQYFGAKQQDSIRLCVRSAFMLQMGIALLFAILTQFWGGPVLALTGVPPELFDDALVYLRISGVTLVFQSLYQFLADSLRAMGDSRTPLIFLGTAMVMNIVLDYIFISSFGWAVAGAAWATTISAVAAGLLCLAYCLVKYPLFRISPAQLLRPSASMLGRVTRFGLPTALQQAVGSLGGMAMQTVVNGFGSGAIAAYNAAFRIDNFLLLPCNVLGVAVSTCTAQNLGAGQDERVTAGLKSASRFSAVFSLIASLLIFVFAPQLVQIFILPEETEIIAMGVWGLRVLAPLFLLCNQLNLFISFFRGAGAVSVAFWVSLANIIIRILFAFSLAPFIGMDAVWFCMPCTWVLCGGFSLWYYLSGRWRRESVAGER